MAALDPERFGLLRRDFGEADLAGLLRTFVDVTTPTVVALGEAATAGDAEACKAAAHRLRGGCLAIGAMELAGLAGRLEERLLDAPVIDADAEALTRQVGPAWAALQDELEPHLAG